MAAAAAVEGSFLRFQGGIFDVVAIPIDLNATDALYEFFVVAAIFVLISWISRVSWGYRKVHRHLTTIVAWLLGYNYFLVLSST